MASAFAQGMKKILPELATSIGVQSARANQQFIHPQPAYAQQPVRGYAFEVSPPLNVGPIALTDLAQTVVTQYRVPQGLNAAIDSFGQALEAPAAFNDVQWRITVNNIPVPNFQDIRELLGTIQAPRKIQILATEGQIVRVEAICLTPGIPHWARAKLSGWTFIPSLQTGMENPNSWRGI